MLFNTLINASYFTTALVITENFHFVVFLDQEHDKIIALRDVLIVLNDPSQKHIHCLVIFFLTVVYDIILLYHLRVLR